MAETKVRNREGEDIKGGFVPRDKKNGKREKGRSAPGRKRSVPD